MNTQPRITAAAVWLMAKIGVVILILTVLLLAGSPVKSLASGARSVSSALGYGIGMVLGGIPDVAKAITKGFELAQHPPKKVTKAVPASPPSNQPSTSTQDRMKSIPPNLH